MEKIKNKKNGEEDKKALEEKIKEIQKKEQNKILVTFLMILGIFVIAFVVWVIISQNASHFEYKGVKFDIVNEIAPYRTAIPVILNSGVTGAATGAPTNYYFYIRNDPKELDKIDFDGQIKFLKDVAIKSEKEFNCDGDGIIGIANLAKLYQVLGTKVIKDQEAECDDQGRYMVWKFVEGNKTEIKEIAPACYEIRIYNCEILKATERFMIESLAEFNKIKEQVNVEP